MVTTFQIRLLRACPQTGHISHGGEIYSGRQTNALQPDHPPVWKLIKAQPPGYQLLFTGTTALDYARQLSCTGLLLETPYSLGNYLRLCRDEHAQSFLSAAFGIHGPYAVWGI